MDRRPVSGQPLPPISLDHVVIKVSDFAVSDEFYRRVFGAEVAAPYPFFHTYRIGDRQLNVHGPGAPIPADRLARYPVEAGNSDLAFQWHGTLEEAVVHLEACGAEIIAPDAATAGLKGAGRSVYFRDPDGSLLEFITYPVGQDAP